MHQQLKLAYDTNVHRLLLPTSPVALMHSVESMGEGHLLGIARARFGAWLSEVKQLRPSSYSFGSCLLEGRRCGVSRSVFR